MQKRAQNMRSIVRIGAQKWRRTTRGKWLPRRFFRGSSAVFGAWAWAAVRGGPAAGRGRFLLRSSAGACMPWDRVQGRVQGGRGLPSVLPRAGCRAWDRAGWMPAGAGRCCLPRACVPCCVPAVGLPVNVPGRFFQLLPWRLLRGTVAGFCCRAGGVSCRACRRSRA